MFVPLSLIVDSNDGHCILRSFFYCLNTLFVSFPGGRLVLYALFVRSSLYFVAVACYQ